MRKSPEKLPLFQDGQLVGVVTLPANMHLRGSYMTIHVPRRPSDFIGLQRLAEAVPDRIEEPHRARGR